MAGMSGEEEASAWLQVGSGDDAELMLVPVLPDPPQPCFCRWHRAVRLARRCTWPVGWVVQGMLCGLRGHRLTVESTDFDGYRTLHCWCAKRYRYIDKEGE
jgi:hypothetical protein